MSGITRSIPSISSSGNISPASMTTMSLPCSSASMFLPISPTPPSGMRRRASLTEQGGLHRFLLGRSLRGRRLGREEERERVEVSDEGRAERRLMERGRWVIQGEHRQAVDGLPHPAVDARDAFVRKELVHRMTAERDDDARLQHVKVAAQPDVARAPLVGQRAEALRAAGAE